MKAATNKGGSPLDPETKPGAASAWWVHGPAPPNPLWSRSVAVLRFAYSVLQLQKVDTSSLLWTHYPSFILQRGQTGDLMLNKPSAIDTGSSSLLIQ